ncbi:Hypothetical protein D9617_29g007260 [Elsinoe fawcettii]|nr:Hypothetical protein D9617_29g007260 [Elsinoe fawcettii]
MRSSISIVAVLLAAGASAYPESLQGKSICSTKLGSKKVKPVPTSKQIQYNTRTATSQWKSTVTISANTTLAASTISSIPYTFDITTNSTSVIYSTVPGPYTYNVTTLVFQNVTTDYTSTSLAPPTTTTLEPSTWTVPPSSGFVPAQSLLPTAKAKRDSPPKPKKKAKSFPARIDCTIYRVTTTTINPAGTAPTTTVIKTISLPALTTTFNLTRTHFASTLTVHSPTWTRTITRNVTETRNNTITRSHSTVSTPTATSTPPALGYIYEACYDDNLLNYTVPSSDPSVHYGITTFDGGDAQLSVARTDTARDCCLKCINGGACGGAVFTQGTCFLQMFDQCKTQKERVMGPFGYDAGSARGEGKYTVINGYCGSWKYGN